jgi:hypothetical protein
MEVAGSCKGVVGSYMAVVGCGCGSRVSNSDLQTVRTRGGEVYNIAHNWK